MNIKKNFLLNSIGGSLYALTSMLFLIIVTRINGVEIAGDFAIAFTFSCLVICIGNYSTRIFQVTERDKNIVDSDFIYQKIITCILMIFASVIFILIINSNTIKSLLIVLLTIYKILESFSETYYGFIQKKNELYKVGISFILKSLLGIITFLIINIYTNNIVYSVIGLIVITMLIIYLYDYNVIKKYSYENNKFNISNVKKLFKIGFCQFVIMFLTLYVINSSKYAIDMLLSSESQTIFNILIMPTTILLMLGQYLMQPFLNTLNDFVKNNNIKAFNKLITKIILFLLVIGILGVALTWIIGIPVLELIYGISLIEYKCGLIIIIIGGLIYSIVFIFSTALTILRETKKQAIIFLIVTFITMIMSYYMVNILQLTGAIISYFITMFILFVLYLLHYISVYKYNIK